jgi:hypothetical protein
MTTVTTADHPVVAFGWIIQQRHAAMHMMMLYYHQGLTLPEEVLPYGDDMGMEEVVEVVEAANEVENSTQNSVPPTSHAYISAPPFLGSTSSSEAVMYDQACP